MESASLITGGNTNAIDSSSELSGAEFNTGGERSSRAISHAVPPIIASLPLLLALASSSPFAGASFRLLLLILILGSSGSFAPSALLQRRSPPSARSSASCRRRSSSSTTFTCLLLPSRGGSCCFGLSWKELKTNWWQESSWIDRGQLWPGPGGGWGHAGLQSSGLLLSAAFWRKIEKVTFLRQRVLTWLTWTILSSALPSSFHFKELSNFNHQRYRYKRSRGSVQKRKQNVPRARHCLGNMDLAALWLAHRHLHIKLEAWKINKIHRD